MACGLHAVECLLDGPIGTDHERRPPYLQTDPFPPTGLFCDRAVLRRELKIFVHEQRESELVFQGELVVGLGPLRAGAEDDNTFLIQL